MISKITTHQSDALKRLMQQFKGEKAPNLIKILNIYLPFIQELEDEVFKLLDALNIDTQVGAFLDFIGEIVGLTRVSGTTDARYRQLLKAKIGTNTSEGLPEQAIAVFKILTQSEFVHFIDMFNGNISLTGTAFFTDQDLINDLFNDMDAVLAAGVRMPFFVCADETEAFAFAGPGPAALGFDDGTGTLGGKLAIEYTKQLPFAFDGVDTETGGFGAGAADPFVGGVFVA